VRNWTQLHFFSLFHCELRVIIYRSHGKLHLFLGKSTKTASTRAALLTPICTKSFVGQSPRPHWGSLDRSPDPLAVFRGLLLNRGEEERSGGEGRGGSSSVAIGRKKKCRRLCERYDMALHGRLASLTASIAKSVQQRPGVCRSVCLSRFFNVNRLDQRRVSTLLPKGRYTHFVNPCAARCRPSRFRNSIQRRHH